MQSSFFPKENLIHPHHVLPYYIHVLFTHCISLSKEILPIPKITSENAKTVSQFLKKLSLAAGQML